MYDVFISFKNLSENGSQTKDSAIASKLYKKLTGAGIDTFFSNAEIQRKKDPRWAEMIDAALKESSVIVVVGTRPGYVESEWVKYEWRYFSDQIRAGRDKQIITVMEGFPLADLPPAFAGVQNYRFGELDKAVDMIRGCLINIKGIQAGTAVPETPRTLYDETKTQYSYQEPGSIYDQLRGYQYISDEEIERYTREYREQRDRDSAINAYKKRRAVISIIAAVLVAAIALAVWQPWAGKKKDKKDNAAEITPAVKPLTELNNVAVGDRFTFGCFPQSIVPGTDTAEDPEPIEWRVLDVQDGKALAISEYLLDARRFDDNNNDWESSEIRQWLNGEFLSGAFIIGERRMLSDIDGDTVTLLTKEQAEGYFRGVNDSMAAPTEYAIMRGAWTGDDITLESGLKTSWWWLRSPGSFGSDCAASVNNSGTVDGFGSTVTFELGCVRPVILISI